MVGTPWPSHRPRRRDPAPPGALVDKAQHDGEMAAGLGRAAEALEARALRFAETPGLGGDAYRHCWDTGPDCG